MSARDLVMNRLVRRVRSFPALDIVPIVTEGLSGRDAGLAWAIDQAVSRRWLTLAAILQSHLQRPWEKIEPGAQAALLAGAAQLVLMDRVPAYAVISEAVEWTKRRVRPKAGGLVNAVLRRVGDMSSAAKESQDVSRRVRAGEALGRRDLPMHDGSVLTFDVDVFAEDEIARLCEQTSHRAELVRRWMQRHDAKLARALALHSIVQPPTIVTDVAEAAQRSDALTPHDQPGFFVFDGDHATLTSLLSSRSACRVQDPTAAKAVGLTKGLTPGVVIDVCAGRGTKTRQLAAAHPNARIIASDASQERIDVLRHVFAGSGQVDVVTAAELQGLAGTADVVLCDVPCSNTGVLARRCEAKYRFDEAHLQELLRLQKAIVQRAISLRKAGGAIVYSTCSIEREENEAMTQALAERGGLSIVVETATMPAGQPGEAAGGYHDGGYAALLS